MALTDARNHPVEDTILTYGRLNHIITEAYLGLLAGSAAEQIAARALAELGNQIAREMSPAAGT